MNYFSKNDIKVYCTKETLADDTREYRTVFESSDTEMIYIDFSFYNLLFAEQEWEARMTIRLFQSGEYSNLNLLREFKLQKVINIRTNIEYVRLGTRGFGTNGKWDEGTYLWEAWIENTKVDSEVFFIQDNSPVNKGTNSYLEINSAGFYLKEDRIRSHDKRTYYKTLQSDAVNSSDLEIGILNKLPGVLWRCELNCDIYNDARQLKHKVSKLSVLQKDSGELYYISIPLRSDTENSWAEDEYTLNIHFMGKLAAVIPFRVSNGFIEGTLDIYLPGQNEIMPAAQLQKKSNINKDTFQKINELIGLQTVKKRLAEYVSYLKFIQLRKQKGIIDTKKLDLHSVFTGNPGTGKTTVANLLGEIYFNLGLLPKNTVYVADRSDLVGEYVGQTAPKVKKVLEKAEGGILFIDEAYTLIPREMNTPDYGRESLEIILQAMSDDKNNFAVIVAGYPDEMRSFIESNPGLKSRFTNWFEFPDYSPDELLRIAQYSAGKKSLNFTAEALSILEKHLINVYRQKDRTFGNARLVNSLVDEARLRMGTRMMSLENPEELSLEELSTITADDLNEVFRNKSGGIIEFPVDEEALHKKLAELNSLIGLSNVKSKINELVKLVKFYKEMGKDVLNSFPLHKVFTGNPGTGKTTVARIIADIYKALGILERGHLVECTRQDLVAGYAGQTAIKTSQLIDKAIGGVLFIDEAYTLTRYSIGNNDNFGLEALDVLLKKMEDLSGKFAIVAAGYPDEMKVFVESNPGLKSRFDDVLEFEDYTAEEMLMIAEYMFAGENIKIEEQAGQKLYTYFDYQFNNKDRFFGNARFVKKIVRQAQKNMYLRVSEIEKDKRTPEMMSTVTLDDLSEFEI